jgi:hypothetical protein
MGGGGGDAVLHVAVELGARRIDRVAGVHQARIGDDPADEIVERLITLDRGEQRRAGLHTVGEACELALVGFLERQALGVGTIEIARDARIVEPRIEVGEIPFRQAGEPGRRFRRSRLLAGGLLGGGAFG